MSFDPNRYLNQSVAAVPKSGIRKFFDVAATIPGAISLGVGEPDFVTPYHIRNAAINSILDGETQYTSNWGLLELRQEIAAYVDNRFHISYDPKNEILVTVGASEGIDLALRALLNPGDEVLVPEPSYVSYAPCVIFAGGTPVAVPTSEANNFVLTPEALEKAITRTRPESAPLIWAMVWASASLVRSSRRMAGSSVSPSALGKMPEEVRTSSGNPTSSSSDCIM